MPDSHPAKQFFPIVGFLLKVSHTVPLSGNSDSYRSKLACFSPDRHLSEKCSILFHCVPCGSKNRPASATGPWLEGFRVGYGTAVFLYRSTCPSPQMGDAKVRTGIHRWSGRVTGVGGAASKARNATADNSRSGSQSRQFLLLHPSPSPRSSSTPGYVSLRERRLAASE